MADHPRHPDDLAVLGDAELVRLAAELAPFGSAAAETARRCLGVVLARHLGLVRAVLGAKVPRDAVDDLESEVVTRFAVKVYAGHAIANPAGLLVRMAMFVRADFLAGRRAPGVPVEEWDGAGDDAALERLSDEAAVAELLAPLTERQREVLWSRLVDGRSSVEVATMHGTTPGNVDVIVHRALARMREAAQ